MKRNPQGRRWHKLDNTGKIFPLIANENLSNVFRISVTLKEEVEPELLQQALVEVLPWFEGFQVKLKRGFFWYYFEHNKRTPYIEKESTYPCRYIDPKSNQLFLFRVSYYEKRINLEVFHAITDGMGAVNFLRELTYRYLQLKRGINLDGGSPSSACVTDVEDSYLKNYKKMPNKRYSSKAAYHLEGQYLAQGAENIIHGCVDLKELKAASKGKGVSITKYLTACLIWTIYEEYLGGLPGRQHIGVNLPINLRAFFGSTTTSNFFAVTAIDYHPEGEHEPFDRILDLVSRQMDDKIVKEKLEETISYNVSNEKKWYVRIIPLFVKWLALGFIFRRNDRAHTITLSNIGPIAVEEEYRDDIEQFHLIIGVSKRQNAKCAVCAYGQDVMISFTSVFEDSRLEDRFFDKLREDGINVRMESNGIAKKECDKGMYPQIEYNPGKWKKLINLFYAVLLTAAVIVGVVNYATYSGLWWSGIAIPGILYAALTFRYSILKHANLGKTVMIETVGLQALLFMIDWVLGYQGWSVNYAIPSTILFADIAVVFLILVNQLNWQSYFMYQIAITIFSFIPIILWAFGLVTNPVMAIITVILSVLILTLTILLGDRRFKNELIRRFHL
ncbi:MAG: MFS transporter [Clostridiaceae bacterium]|nr:MFS transporter [Clostridiaceae bacterium]